MWPFALAAALAIVPVGEPLTDQVDSLEINHVYDDCGRAVFTQAIARQWNPYTARDEIRAWWQVTTAADEPSAHMVLRFDHGKLRRIRAARVYVTHTQYDRELAERETLPMSERRGLTIYRRLERTE
jgi:hypothetical protein